MTNKSSDRHSGEGQEALWVEDGQPIPDILSVASGDSESTAKSSKSKKKTGGSGSGRRWGFGKSKSSATDSTKSANASQKDTVVPKVLLLPQANDKRNRAILAREKNVEAVALFEEAIETGNEEKATKSFQLAVASNKLLRKKACTEKESDLLEKQAKRGAKLILQSFQLRTKNKVFGPPAIKFKAEQNHAEDMSLRSHVPKLQLLDENLYTSNAMKGSKEAKDARKLFSEIVPSIPKIANDPKVKEVESHLDVPQVSPLSIAPLKDLPEDDEDLVVAQRSPLLTGRYSATAAFQVQNPDELSTLGFDNTFADSTNNTNKKNKSPTREEAFSVSSLNEIMDAPMSSKSGMVKSATTGTSTKAVDSSKQTASMTNNTDVAPPSEPKEETGSSKIDTPTEEAADLNGSQGPMDDVEQEDSQEGEAVEGSVTTKAAVVAGAAVGAGIAAIAATGTDSATIEKDMEQPKEMPGDVEKSETDTNTARPECSPEERHAPLRGMKPSRWKVQQAKKRRAAETAKLRPSTGDDIAPIRGTRSRSLLSGFRSKSKRRPSGTDTTSEQTKEAWKEKQAQRNPAFAAALAAQKDRETVVSPLEEKPQQPTIAMNKESEPAKVQRFIPTIHTPGEQEEEISVGSGFPVPSNDPNQESQPIMLSAPRVNPDGLSTMSWDSLANGEATVEDILTAKQEKAALTEAASKRNQGTGKAVGKKRGLFQRIQRAFSTDTANSKNGQQTSTKDRCASVLAVSGDVAAGGVAVAEGEEEKKENEQLSVIAEISHEASKSLPATPYRDPSIKNESESVVVAAVEVGEDGKVVSETAIIEKDELMKVTNLTGPRSASKLPIEKPHFEGTSAATASKSGSSESLDEDAKENANERRSNAAKDPEGTKAPGKTSSVDTTSTADASSDREEKVVATKGVTAANKPDGEKNLQKTCFKRPGFLKKKSQKMDVSHSPTGVEVEPYTGGPIDMDEVSAGSGPDFLCSA